MIKLTEYIRWRLMRKYYNGLINPHSKIIDIGAGNLHISKLMQGHFNAEVIGTDVIDFSGRHKGLLGSLKRTGPDYVKNVIMKNNKLPFGDNSFDYATFNCVLHHIDYEQQSTILKEAKRVAKKIIIFEDKKNFSSFIWDKIFCPREMNVPYTYRHVDDWIRLFKTLGLNPSYYDVKRPFYYPIKHLLFVAE